jgi:hypothetical protein
MLQNKKVCKEVPHNHQDARLRMPLIIDLSRHWRRSCNDGAVWTLTMALADCCCSQSQGDDTVPPTHCNFQLTSGVYIASEKDDGPFDCRRYTAAAPPRLENLFVVMFEVSRRSAQATKEEKCARACAPAASFLEAVQPFGRKARSVEGRDEPCCNLEAAASQLQAIIVRLVCLKTNYCGD